MPLGFWGLRIRVPVQYILGPEMQAKVYTIWANGPSGDMVLWNLIVAIYELQDEDTIANCSDIYIKPSAPQTLSSLSSWH